MGIQANIRTKPVPVCPDCDALMVLRMPKENQTWEPFWGCSTFPKCRATRNIKSNGLPEEDEDFDDDDFESWRPGWPGDYGDS